MVAHNPQLAAVIVLSLDLILFAAYVYVLITDGRRRTRETIERYGGKEPDAYGSPIVLQTGKGRVAAYLLFSVAILLALMVIVMTADNWDVLQFAGVAILSFLLFPAVGGAIRATEQIRASEMGLLRISAVNGNSMLRWNDVRYILYDDEDRIFIISDGLSEDEIDPDSKDVECNEFCIPTNLPRSSAMMKMVLERVEKGKWRNAKSLRKAGTIASGSDINSKN
jgi:hypothetical protein